MKHAGDTHAGDRGVTSRVTAPSPALPYNKKITDRRSRRTSVDMCARSSGAHPKTRLTARPYNGYIGGLTVRSHTDRPPMKLHSADRHRARTATHRRERGAAARLSRVPAAPARPTLVSPNSPATGSTGSGAPASSGDPRVLEQPVAARPCGVHAVARGARLPRSRAYSHRRGGAPRPRSQVANLRRRTEGLRVA